MNDAEVRKWLDMITALRARVAALDALLGEAIPAIDLWRVGVARDLLARIDAKRSK